MHEALPSLPGLLPHQHSDLEDRYPKAQCHSPVELPDAPDPLEQRGQAIGEAAVRRCFVQQTSKAGAHTQVRIWMEACHVMHDPEAW